MLPITAPAHAEQASARADDAGAQATDYQGEIVVTATRKATAISRTPASIVAKGREELDVQGVRSIADVASITPGITFGQSAVVYGTGQTTISIRGVDSQSGIPTTGVYIDDTPIQTRVGVSPSLSNVYPQVFDLERIEVLRGPQGTLFGSGSVGGAIRFITPRPNYTGMDLYARSELASTLNGGLSYEGGVALGAPFVEDKIGFRASIWYRHDGGYVDRLDPYTQELVKKDIDEADSLAGRIAVGFKPTETLTITPSFFFQELRIEDGSRFELATSDLSSGDLRLSLNQLAEPRTDRFKLPALKMELELGGVSLISDTSYFYRTTETINDDKSLSFVFSGGLIEKPFPAGFEDYAPYTLNQTKQTAFTQELRLQDNNQDDRFNWIAGLFYQKSFVRDQYGAFDPRLLDVINLGRAAQGEPLFDSLTDSFFGTELYQGLYSNFVRNEHRDTQYAAYAQGDYEIIEGLKLTAGLRYTIAKYKFVGFGAGPVPSTDGQTDLADTTSKTLTPKFGVSFQADRNNLFYASASKGVRGPGVSSPVGANCIDDAAAIGFDPFATLEVKPDSIWSYEIGSKNRLFGGKVAIDASAYRIDWKDVQTLFALPQCTIQTALNLGSAKIEGFDLAVSVKPVTGLTLGASASYINARYTTAIPGPDDTIIRKAGEPFPLVAPWTLQLNGEYVQPVGSAELYGRADFSYASRITKPVDAESPLVDPTLPRPPSTSQLDLRLGGRFGTSGGKELDLSVFVNNVTNSLPLLALFHETPDSTFYRAGTFRPRTVGVTLSIRN
ncbi:MAG: TonB-dependent receptor [Alphaproteobacteria bacterium]|nr:TonB-dependent receptor [Alphaproteobacteria bacterium]MBU0876652.1 TonB-dependent receptor [Alphaproteobacteria bacterium]MBU1769354.1 TonB-dependent receptor [Alphaproteobacteria bacterium]